MNKLPYMHVVDKPIEMMGKGAPRSTTFGVIGMTKYDPYTRTLGGLVQTTTDVRASKVAVPASSEPKNTEFHILGPASKTKVPGQHYGQVPYPGAFRSHLGTRV